ncbi:MAG: abortive infection protein [Lachnospiraceae bacterium]|nr:abortive infection protein [Lachnospiraceae bacterium]
MKRDKNVSNIVEKQDGIILTKQLLELGYNKMQIEDYVQKGFLIREKWGTYTLPEICIDEYKSIQCRSEKIIFSYATALFFHGMCDRVPHILDVTVPQGDNVSRIKRDHSEINFHYCKKDLWDLGLTTVTTPQGFKVNAYDKERCICDIIKNRKNIDKQIYVQAIKEYFYGSYDHRKLLKYAKIFNIEDKVRVYMEVM